MDYTKELEIIEIIKKHIYCDKHNSGDLVGFMLVDGIDEDYKEIKEFFGLTLTDPFQEIKFDEDKTSSSSYETRWNG